MPAGGAPELRMHVNKARGFHLTAPSIESLPVEELRQVAQVGKAKARFFSTNELLGLNVRIRSNISAILSITDHMVDQLVGLVRDKLAVLHSVADACRELDVLQSLATARITMGVDHLSEPRWKSLFTGQRSVSVSLPGGVAPREEEPSMERASVSLPGYVPLPEEQRVAAASGQRTKLKIQGCRHPSLARGGSFIPNSLTLGGESPSILLITGPNGSGKSTLLTTVGHCVVMAHVCGATTCERLEMEPIDALFTRMGFADDMEAQASSFLVEMREASMILQHATPHSLVLIDELGRSTHAVDGAAIAWAMIEELLKTGSSCLFVTHMHELAMLEDLYPSQVGNLSMKVEASRTPAGGLHVRPLFSVAATATELTSGYGIAALEQAGFPPSIVEAARDLHREMLPLSLHQQLQRSRSEHSKLEDYLRAVLSGKVSLAVPDEVMEWALGLCQPRTPPSPKRRVAESAMPPETQEHAAEEDQSSPPITPSAGPSWVDMLM
jgi:DNA mismatch repair ATPase MutS